MFVLFRKIYGVGALYIIYNITQKIENSTDERRNYFEIAVPK